MLHTIGRTIEANGARLHSQRHGPATGRPLLLLHGGGGSLEDFAPLLPFLDGHPIVLLDARGQGASTLGEAPLDYGLLADDAEATIAAYALDRPVVVGHSDGGIVALELAARGCPLGGIVTLGADADPPGPELDAMLGQVTAASWREQFPDDVALYQRINPAPDLDRLMTAITTMWRSAAPDNYPGSRIERIACPALILGGDADPLVPRATTVALAARIVGATLGILPFAGHGLPGERPERIAPYIVDFLHGLDDEAGMGS